MSADRCCTRRDALALFSSGFGLVALADLLAQESRSKAPAFAPRAKSVILCYMSGGVSHVDTFDPKPELARLSGKPMPVPVLRTQFNQNGTVQPSHWEFKKRGRSGLPVSTNMP